MKKFIKKAILCLCLAGTGVGFTSCDGDVLGGSLGQFISVILNGNNKTYSYAGVADLATYQLQQLEDGTFTYDPNKGTNYKLNLTSSITLYNDSTCTIKLNDFKIGDANVNGFTFSTYYYDGKIDPEGPSMLTGATCVLNGNATDVEVTAFKGSITSGTDSKMTLSDIYIQFEDFLIKGSFSGTNTTSVQ